MTALPSVMYTRIRGPSHDQPRVSGSAHGQFTSVRIRESHSYFIMPREEQSEIFCPSHVSHQPCPLTTPVCTSIMPPPSHVTLTNHKPRGCDLLVQSQEGGASRLLGCVALLIVMGGSSRTVQRPFTHTAREEGKNIFGFD